MENKFYTDDEFEHFLKDATDNFRMYPSKKVWYSIYNDLHPSRKWPSLAVCLILIAAILFVGVSNNNLINQSSRSALATNLLNTTTTSLTDKNTTIVIGSDSLSTGVISAETRNTAAISGIAPPAGNRTNAVSFNNAFPSENDVMTTATTDRKSYKNDLATNGTNDYPEVAVPVTNTDVTVAEQNTQAGSSPRAAEKKRSTVQFSADDNTDETFLAAGVNNDVKTLASTQTVATVDLLRAAATATSGNKKTAPLNTEANTENKAWIESFAFNNKASVSKFKRNGAIEYYVTPSVGFRFLKKNNKYEPGNPGQNALVSAGNVVVPDLGINDEVTQTSAINLEAGISLLYKVSKNVRLKSGFQVNYTSYISFADPLKHPMQAFLLLNNNNGGYAMQARSSIYGNSINGQKTERLNNKTVQLSLPVGADVKLAGKQNLKWYAGATIQPSIITGGQMFAVSADTKNYVQDNSLLRKWNLSAGVETFVSYKTPSGIVINAGPQIRYQFLSTYTKQYSYTEKLYNIGVKLGITKSF